MLEKSVGLLALENIFGDFVSTITGGVKSTVDNVAIRKAFNSCAEIIRHFENTGEDSFGEAIQLAFSKENLQTIYRKLKNEPGYNYSSYIHQQLKEICAVYEIEADNFIDSFIKMFNSCLYEYDRDLYAEIYQGEWREDERNMHLMLSAKIDDIKELIVFQQKERTIPLISDTDISHKQSGTEIDDYLLEWNLSYPKTNGFYTNDDEKKSTMLRLTMHWKNERLKAPAWYIIPVGKRGILKAYTCDEELLYRTPNVSLEEKFDFAYELVWRYEAAFITYSAKLQTEIRNVWNQMDWETMDSNRKVHWFYIGQALLREYREELDFDNWNVVYRALWDKRSSVMNGEAELSLERIKLLFMQMKIADTRDGLMTFQYDASAVGVRLQIAGLKAECGLLNEAMQDLKELEKDLLSIIQTDPNKQNHVMYKSILSGTYFLQSFVLQAIEPFQRGEQLKSIWNKLHNYDRYFDFDQEKQSAKLELYRSLKKENKEEAFEINRESKTITFSNHRFSEVYDLYRLLDRLAIPLHIGYTRLLEDDEADFIKVLLEDYQYIGWYMLLRFGSTKTIKKVLSRKECIILNFDNQDRLKKVFDYIFNSLDGNITSIQSIGEQHNRNAYGHILANGLEILKRLASTTNIVGQKKLICLMCRLIDTDIVKEYGVLNNWIGHIMHITEDRVKAMMLNELLTCSAKERTHFSGEKTLDPFDVFATFVQAKHFYQFVDIDPDIIDNMLEKASLCEEEKKHFVPRLGQMSEWGLLTNEQSEKFANLLWDNISDEILLPYNDEYYSYTFLRWPHPVEIDVAERIRRKLLDSKKFDIIKNRELSSITLGDNIYLQQILNLNRNISDFWKIDEISLLIKGLLDCWQVLVTKFLEVKHSEFYKEEFIARTKLIIHVIASFDRKQIQKIDISILKDMKKMIEKMMECGIEAIEISAMITSDDNLSQIVKAVINGLRSVNKEKVDASVYAAEILVHECYHIPAVQDILKEMLTLCLYRKEPGLKHYLNTVHDLLYSVQDIELSVDILKMLNAILDNIDEQTNYINNIEKSEKEIKGVIQTRISCAMLSYQLYRYEQRNQMSHSSSVLNWKDICRGKKSGNEFVEVKRCWLE